MPCCGMGGSSIQFNTTSFVAAIVSTIGFGAAVGAGVSFSSILNPMLALPGLAGLALPALFPQLINSTSGMIRTWLGKLTGNSLQWLYSDLGAITAALAAAGVVYYVQGFGMEMGIGALGAALGWVIGASIWSYS